MTGASRQRLRVAALLSLAFGLGMAVALVAAFVAHGRAMTSQGFAAASYLGAAAFVSACLAHVAMRLLRRRPWSARYAAALAVLLSGTGAGTPVLVALDMALRSSHLLEAPVHIIILVLGIMSAASMFYFLTIAGHLILPIAVVFAFATAALLARRSR